MDSRVQVGQTRRKCSQTSSQGRWGHYTISDLPFKQTIDEIVSGHIIVPENKIDGQRCDFGGWPTWHIKGHLLVFVGMAALASREKRPPVMIGWTIGNRGLDLLVVSGMSSGMQGPVSMGALSTIPMPSPPQVNLGDHVVCADIGNSHRGMEAHPSSGSTSSARN